MAHRWTLRVVAAVGVVGILGGAAAWAAQPPGRITATYDATMEIGLTAGAGAVWFVTSGGTNGVVGIDAASGKRFPTIPLGRRVDTSQEIYVGAVGLGSLGSSTWDRLCTA